MRGLKHAAHLAAEQLDGAAACLHHDAHCQHGLDAPREELELPHVAPAQPTARGLNKHVQIHSSYPPPPHACIPPALIAATETSASLHAGPLHYRRSAPRQGKARQGRACRSPEGVVVYTLDAPPVQHAVLAGRQRHVLSCRHTVPDAGLVSEGGRAQRVAGVHCIAPVRRCVCVRAAMHPWTASNRAAGHAKSPAGDTGRMTSTHAACMPAGLSASPNGRSCWRMGWTPSLDADRTARLRWPSPSDAELVEVATSVVSCM